MSETNIQQQIDSLKNQLSQLSIVYYKFKQFEYRHKIQKFLYEWCKQYPKLNDEIEVLKNKYSGHHGIIQKILIPQLQKNNQRIQDLLTQMHTPAYTLSALYRYSYFVDEDKSAAYDVYSNYLICSKLISMLSGEDTDPDTYLNKQLEKTKFIIGKLRKRNLEIQESIEKHRKKEVELQEKHDKLVRELSNIDQQLCQILKIDFIPISELIGVKLSKNFLGKYSYHQKDSYHYMICLHKIASFTYNDPEESALSLFNMYDKKIREQTDNIINRYIELVIGQR